MVRTSIWERLIKEALPCHAGTLLEDEAAALAGLRIKEPDVFALLHFLLTPEDGSAVSRGFDLLFQTLGATKVSDREAVEIARRCLRKWGCSSYAVDEALFQEPLRTAFAYVVAWLRVAGATSVLPQWVRKQHPAVLPLSIRKFARMLSFHL